MPCNQPQLRQFHFGLSVADLDRAVKFYRILFNCDPIKHFEDYAKFVVTDPPIVLALHPGGGTPGGGAINHLGFRVPDSESLMAVQHRLEAAGIATQREEGVECCYALQTKFWVPDADANLWEVYTLQQDLEHSGFGGEDAKMPARPETQAPVIWEHMLMAQPPEQIPHEDGSVDEVRLIGTFNAGWKPTTRRRLLQEAFRVLQPGGILRVHGLVSDRPFPGVPNLPGPAAMVREILEESIPLNELAEVGFVGLNCDKLGDIHCFQAGGVDLRELQLSAIRPDKTLGEANHYVLYRGPLSSVAVEDGRQFQRGQRTPVDQATWQLFQEPRYAEHFTCFRCPIAAEKTNETNSVKDRTQQLTSVVH